MSAMQRNKGASADISLRAWLQLARETLPAPTPTPE
jgi:hypothetical protein